MKGYAYEIRRYPLRRFDGALPHHPAIYLGDPYNAGYLLERCTIDHATPHTREVIDKQMARLAAEWQHVGPSRLRVMWLRSPRGPHARLFRDLRTDIGTG
jgi:hypothetical protein